MAGRQLKDMIRAFNSRDEVSFRRAVLEIVEEEEARHHLALARDMRGLLASGGATADISVSVKLPEAPKARDGEWDLIDVRHGVIDQSNLVLEPDVDQLLSDVSAEVGHWEALQAEGVSKRQRILFVGPAGTGKTSAAEALATRLAWPLAIVSVESVVSSYLGETASNLRRVFEFAERQRVVLVFDEFDALGRMRDDSSEHGEMKRVVSSFLQFLERYRGPSIIIAITNYPELLDFALWRRFDEVAKFKLPTVHMLRRILRLRSRSMRERPFNIETAATRLKGLPHAAAEKFVLDLRRTALIEGTSALTPELVSECLRKVRERPW